MGDFSSTVGVVALVGCALAAVALLCCLVLLLRLRRLRAAQRAILGPDGTRDLVQLGSDLQDGFRALHDYVHDVAERQDGRLTAAEGRLHGAVAHCGLVRYDAYNEMSGRQSTSIALLDSSASGIVLSSIHHRDQARLYAKRVQDGRGELELSPEEQEAVRLALA
jgi:uncharacterized protein DUF4446